jgi:hypothetical protein
MRFLLYFVFTAAAITVSNAQLPSLLNYQGHLLDATGSPATGTVEIVIALYTDAIEGTLAYEEHIGPVELDRGIYSFNYGTNEVGLSSALNHAALWVQLEIDGDPLLPRSRLNAVPYALKAGEAYSLREPVQLGFGEWELRNGNTVYLAEADGFASYVAAAGGLGKYSLRSDTNNPPTIIRAHGEFHNYTAREQTIISPIKKGDYWILHTGGTSGTVYWMPIISQ